MENQVFESANLFEASKQSLILITLKSFFSIFKKNDPINYLIHFKKKVLSEEEIFTHHFLLKSLRHAFIEKTKN